MNCSTPGLPVHHHLPELAQTHVHQVIDAIQPSHPLSSPCPPALNLSKLRVFSNESVLQIRWPKYWSFNFNISPSNEHPGRSPLGWTGWISLQSKGLSRVFQHHSSKASILLCLAFFIIQLSHPFCFFAAAAAKPLQSCPTLCDPMTCSTPGLPIYHQLLESTQTHVH